MIRVSKKGAGQINSTPYFKFDKLSDLYNAAADYNIRRIFLDKRNSPELLQLEFLANGALHHFSTTDAAKFYAQEAAAKERFGKALCEGSILLGAEGQKYLIYGVTQGVPSQIEQFAWREDASTPVLHKISTYDFKRRLAPKVFGQHPAIIAEATLADIHRIISMSNRRSFHSNKTEGNSSDLKQRLDAAYKAMNGAN